MVYRHVLRNRGVNEGALNEASLEDSRLLMYHYVLRLAGN